MTLSPFASTLLVLWYVAGSITGTIGLVFLAIALRRLDARLSAIEDKISPTLEKSENILADIEQRVQSAGDATIRILDKTESAAAAVEATAQKSKSMTTRALHYPLVEVNAVAYGIIAGLTTFLRKPSARIEGKTK